MEPFLLSSSPFLHLLFPLSSPSLGKTPTDSSGAGDYGVPNPGPAFKEVWQVKVWPKGLGQAKNQIGRASCRERV